MSSPSLPARNQLPVQRTWDAQSVFPSDQAWTQACTQLESELPQLAEFVGHLGENAQILADWFNRAAQMQTLAGKIAIYAGLFYYTDADNQEAGSMMGRARGLFSRTQAALAFAEPEIMAIGFETLDGWVAAEPRLAYLAHYVDRLRLRQNHIRSGDVEEVLALAGDPFSTATATYGILVNADLHFEPAHSSQGESFDVAQGSITGLLADPDRETRRTAWESYADGYLGVRNTLSNLLVTSVKQDAFAARVRGYASTLDASLAPNRIPPEVFHNLVDLFQRNLPVWHRYWQIRRRAMGVERLHEYDVAAPLTAQKPHVSYEQMVEWIAAGMQPLGDDYVAALRRGALQERWVDALPNQGKRAGAFSYGGPGTHPFIMMSSADDLFSLSTLAHELGHSMHSYYSRKSQPVIYSRYSLFVAEVASNFNQALVRDHLFATQPDPDFQIALIEEAMANFHRYFFIMPTLARFEYEVHRRVWDGAAPSAQELNDLMADLLAEGYGGEVALDRDRMGITWAQFGHLYSNFYVYQYATGISGANALAQDILQGKAGGVERYLDFLKAGGSCYPLDALAQAGVDLTGPGAVEVAFGVLAELVDRLEQLVG